MCCFSVGLAAESDDDAGLSPLEKFQVVLQKQSDALISLGFDPTVKVRMVMYVCNTIILGMCTVGFNSRVNVYLLCGIA